MMKLPPCIHLIRSTESTDLQGERKKQMIQTAEPTRTETWHMIELSELYLVKLIGETRTLEI